MELWQLALIVCSLFAATAAFIWNALKVGHHHIDKHPKTGADAKLLKDVDQDIEHIFDDQFRQELRNRGRIHFEKIIGENAMFLQQDLRLTTSQLNQFMKTEITRTLKEEFAKYEESITDAKQLAIESIKKTQDAIEQQRVVLSKQLETEVAAERERLLEHFDKNMAEIINHYVTAAIGNQIDLEDQLEYILGELEANKKEILSDIKNGA